MRKLLIGAFALMLSAAGAQAACTDFVGMNISDQAVGKFSLSQLWNPPASGKVLSISSMRFAVTAWAQTPAGTRAGDMLATTVALPTGPVGSVHCKNIADTTLPAGEMHIDTVTTASQTGVKPFYELWPSKPEDDREYTFVPPLVVPPGSGVIVRGAQTAMYVVTSWQWTEATAP